MSLRCTHTGSLFFFKYCLELPWYFSWFPPLLSYLAFSDPVRSSFLVLRISLPLRSYRRVSFDAQSLLLTDAFLAGGLPANHVIESLPAPNFSPPDVLCSFLSLQRSLRKHAESHRMFNAPGRLPPPRTLTSVDGLSFSFVIDPTSVLRSFSTTFFRYGGLCSSRSPRPSSEYRMELFPDMCFFLFPWTYLTLRMFRFVLCTIFDRIPPTLWHLSPV